jgi:hypothetical protein
MHVPIDVKSPNNTSKWQMGFNSAFTVINQKHLRRAIKMLPAHSSINNNGDFSINCFASSAAAVCAQTGEGKEKSKFAVCSQQLPTPR